MKSLQQAIWRDFSFPMSKVNNKNNACPNTYILYIKHILLYKTWGSTLRNLRLTFYSQSLFLNSPYPKLKSIRGFWYHVKFYFVELVLIWCRVNVDMKNPSCWVSVNMTFLQFHMFWIHLSRKNICHFFMLNILISYSFQFLFSFFIFVCCFSILSYFLLFFFFNHIYHLSSPTFLFVCSRHPMLM